MIKQTKPLSMAESLEYLKGENSEETKKFIKEFVSIDSKKAKELREKLDSLDLIKLNEKHVSKIIDVLPEDKEELNKILDNAGLDEKETNDILQTIKEFK